MAEEKAKGRTLCVYCSAPIDGYVISAGSGVAHEDPCTDELCQCGHSAEEHYGKGLKCMSVPDDDDQDDCECQAWNPFRIAFEVTERGFALGTFRDQYGAACSVQDSSLATEPALWLGVDKPELKVFTPNGKPSPWADVPLPVAPPGGHVLHTGRMHLTVPMAIALRDVIDRFIEKGSVRP